MSIERIMSIKIISFDLDNSSFENLMKLLNTEGFKFKLSEIPCYGFQDDKNNLRINLYPKNKVEFLASYENVQELHSIKRCIALFLDNAALYFKALSMELGRIYTNEGNILNTFVKPEFCSDDCLKYKLCTEIKSAENGQVLYTTNYHFYNFNNIKNENGIAGIIKEEFLNNLEKYTSDFENCFKG